MSSNQSIVPNSAGDQRALREKGVASNAATASELRDEADPLVDFKLVKDLTRFVLNACRRRRKVVISITAAALVVGVLSALLLPKQYYTETKLLADRNVVMPLLGNPGRRMADEADTPTRLASEIIMTRTNLEAVVKTADLLNERERKRSALTRLKLRVTDMMKKRRPTPEDEMNDVVWDLRTKMNVRVGDGTVIIGVVWNDSTDAFRIVQAAQQLFLEERQTQELTLIAGSIAILEKRALQVQGDIASMLDTLTRQRVALTPAESRPIAAVVRSAQASAELIAAQASLDQTSRAINDIEQVRNRRIAELQATLAEQKNIYGAAHPQIVNTEQQLRAMQVEPPQLDGLRAEETKLRTKVARLGGSSVAAPGVATGQEQLLAAAALRSMADMRTDSIVQEKQTYGRSRLRIALSSYQALLERLDAARIELQTVRATFKFKYGVLIPAMVPKAPIGLSSRKVVAGALIAGIFLSVFAAVALDLAGGRVLESWQIERTLRLPVLGEARALR